MSDEHAHPDDWSPAEEDLADDVDVGVDDHLRDDEPALAAHPADDAAAPTPDGAPFSGDTGQLPLDTRRVLAQLLAGPSIDAKRKSKLWPVLLRDEQVIRSRLHELFMELVIDRDQKVAFTRQVESEDLDMPTLLRRHRLTYVESVLMLLLRQRVTHADSQGERAVVSQEELLDQLRSYEPAQNSDSAKFERQLKGAIDKMKKLSILRALSGAADRFEVSPTLKLLLSAETVQGLMRTYDQMASKTPATDPEADGTAPGEVTAGGGHHDDAPAGRADADDADDGDDLEDPAE